MTKQQFLNTIKIPKLTLKMGGIYLFYPRPMNLKQYMKYSWFFYFNMIALTTDVFGEMVWFVNGARSGKSFVELTFNAPCMVFSILGSTKLYYLFTRRHILTDLVSKLQEIYPDSLDNGDKKITEETMRFLRIIVNITFYLNAVLVWLFNLLPLARMGYTYHITGEVEFLLPYLIAYPFNEFDVRIWPIVYIRQMWSGIFTTIGIAGPDTFYYACCSHIRMHFLILRNRLERSVAQAVEPEVRRKLTFMDEPLNSKLWSVRGVKVDHEMLEKNFVNLVKNHQDLIELVMQLEELYSMSTLVNYVSSSVLICLTGFNILAIDASQLMIFLVFFASCLSQIFMFCLFGNMIKESSVQVSDAIYHSHWYLANVKTRRLMLISLLRAQKACKLTAFKFADVNLSSFTSILGKSWSYFALLNTVYNPDSVQRGSHE